MATEQKIKSESKLAMSWHKWRGDGALILVLVGMIVWIICILLSSSPEKPSWLLVPLTVIYAVFTLWMAAAAFQNALAARRSAEAMEASVEEQRQSRWAAFAATLTFPDGFAYKRAANSTVVLSLGNPYRQPIVRLFIRLWEMEDRSVAQGQIKYSTMRESSPMDVSSETGTLTIELRPTTQPEAERVRVANLALERFRHVMQGAVPTSALCLITYSHRAQINDAVYVYDLTPLAGES